MGAILGATWEVGWDLLGEEFCAIHTPGLVVVPGTRAVLHSLGDATLFLIGAQLCRDLLPAPHFQVWFGRVLHSSNPRSSAGPN